MNIAIYARVSTDTQAKDGTIHSQIEALREYAQANNLTIAHECIDDGFSGAYLNRPGLDRLRDLSYEGSIQGVLILSPDRLSRKQGHQIYLLEEFKKQKIKVIFTSQKYEDTPEDNFMLLVQGAVSEYERAKILERTRRGIKHAVKKGQVIGSNAPYGYRFVRKTESTPAHWEVDPQEAELVRLVFELYVNKSMKGTEIARYLESEGIPSRSSYKKWWSSAVYGMLKNETYLGTANMFKTRVTDPRKHPKVKKYRKQKKSGKEPRPREDWIGIPVTPLIDKETWDAAQKLLKQNAYRARRNNNKSKYLLRGLAIYGLCGSMAPGYVSNKKTYYSCGAKRNKNITSKPHDENIIVRHKQFDTLIWTGLVELLDDPENLKAQLEKRLERKNAHVAPVNPDNAKTENALEKLGVQEQRILDAYREGIISIDELKDQKEKISTKRKALKAKRKAALSRLESSGQPDITMDVLGDVSARFSRVMAKADFQTREKLANLLINSVTLYTDKAIVKGNVPVIRGDVLNPSNPGSSFLVTARSFTTVRRRRPNKDNRFLHPDGRIRFQAFS